jgi:hypothetical protein
MQMQRSGLMARGLHGKAARAPSDPGKNCIDKNGDELARWSKVLSAMRYKSSVSCLNCQTCDQVGR